MDVFAIKAKKLKKSFDDFVVLKDINLEIEKNRSIAIMGESGEGKTTLLHILGTLDSFDEGDLEILDQKAAFSKNNFLGEKIGFIFQSYNLLEDLTLLDNVLMPAYIARKNIKKNSPIYQRALNLIKDVGLTSKVDLFAKNLSGGEMQRAAIARALVLDPDIILADEPSGNLDFKNSQNIHQLLINFQKKHQKCLIVATHDKNLASLCDKTYLLKDGGITQLIF
ncbi:MAG: ABC transporter ATP-binding protein [Parachlamydiales bacterium]|nr:ABC transporter ATP-binding protein [Parachlamydiales bacterium]